MDFESKYEVEKVSEFILDGNFCKVALQFPDELLKDSTRVASALRNKLRSLRESSNVGNENVRDVKFYVMADTAYGSCCVDEVGVSHVNADCVIHYGHTCLSPPSQLPAFFVFGKADIDVSNCAERLYHHAAKSQKPVLVIFGLEYAYAMPKIKEALNVELLKWHDSTSNIEFQFAEVISSSASSSGSLNTSIGQVVQAANEDIGEGTRNSIGGLTWDLPMGRQMEEYLLCWIGQENPAFANVVLTFNSCEIVRYDATGNSMEIDTSHQKRILRRRYYLVEKAKDANIVGILVGTLGVAGYLHMIHQMKELVTRAGKKAYTFVMGRPNPAKLANFPECDVFIYVSCAQTALLDSKDFLAPIITPFEAMHAFNRGSQWTGSYVIEFRDLISSSPMEASKEVEEARFSFLKGGYVEDYDLQDNENEEEDGVLELVNATEKALQVIDKSSLPITKGAAKTGAEFFASRTYHGLEIQDSAPQPYLVGRSGRASGYADEKSRQ